MDLKRPFIFSFLLLSAVYHHQTLARDLKKIDEFQTKNQVTKFNEMNSSSSPFFSEIATNGFLTFAGWQTHKGEFHGASAKMSLWVIPNVKQNSISQYTISVGDGFYYMTTGFHVYPALYQNHDLRFFTYWTVDGGATTGCYNTQCPGFVVADEATIHPGQALATPLSTYNGEDNYWAILSIKKDEQTQDWSLYRTSQGKTTLLGWWPKTLFESDKVPKVQFNGMVFYNLHNESPPMGSGHFAAEGDRKAAYFKQITLYDTNGNGYVPSPSNMVSSKEDALGCYTVSSLEETQDDGLMFYYGGPGCKG